MRKIKEDLLQEVGQRIREVRLANDIAQKQLADEFESEQSRISKIEKGGREPGTDFYYWFAERTGCSLDYLIRGIDRKVENIKKESVDGSIVDVYKKLVDIHFSSDVIQEYLNDKLKSVRKDIDANELTDYEQKIIETIRKTDEKHYDDIYVHLLSYYK